MKRLQFFKGFTLLEILLVVSIVAVLCVFIIPVFLRASSVSPVPDPATAGSAAAAPAPPVRLIVKEKAESDPVKASDARIRFESLKGQCGVLSDELLYKDMIPIWQADLSAFKAMPSLPSQDPMADRGAEASAALEEYHFDKVHVLTLPLGADAAAGAQAFAADPGVEYADVDCQIVPEALPNDPLLRDQSGGWRTMLWQNPFPNQWNLQMVDAENAWAITKGAGVVVAVLGTGVDYTHPDLAANIWINPGEDGLDATGRDKRTNGVDDDRNGRIDDWRGYDVADNNNNPMDCDGHETAVSGVIAAVQGNGIGISGIAPEAKILPVKMYTTNRFQCGLAELIAAIQYAGSFREVKVINASVGFPGARASSLAEAVHFVTRVKGIVFVAAAGNEARDIGDYTQGSQPACLREAISVGGCNEAREFRSWNFGFSLDVAAPAGGSEQPASNSPFSSILTLLRNPAPQRYPVVVPGYTRVNGTSFSSPLVAGIAALIKARYPQHLPEQVRQAIRHTAQDAGAPGFDRYFGYGIPHATRALGEASPLSVRIIRWMDMDTNNPSQIRVGRSVGYNVNTLRIVGMAYGPNFLRWRLKLGRHGADPETDMPTSWTVLATGNTGTDVQPDYPGALKVLLDWDVRPVSDGTYTLLLEGEKQGGAIYEDRVVVGINRVILTGPDPDISDMQVYRAGEQVRVTGTVKPAGLVRYVVSIRRSDGTALNAPVITYPPGGNTVSRTNELLATWNTTGIPAGRYTIRLEVQLSAGGPIVQETVVVVDPTLSAGQGPNRWPVRRAVSSWGTRAVDHLTAADINGDGCEEILVASGDTVTAYDWTAARVWQKQVLELRLPSQGPPAVPLEFVRTPAVADLNGNGTPEIVAPRLDGKVYMWEGNDAVAGWPITFSPDPAVAIADVDGNGQKDIVVVCRNAIYVVNRAGQALPGWPLRNPDIQRFLTPAAVGNVDASADGKLEIAVVVQGIGQSGGPEAHLALFDSTGRMIGGWPQRIQVGVSPPPCSPALGDLDGDGELEIVVGTGDGLVYAFRRNGALLPGWPRMVNPRTAITGVALGDVDGDNRLEVVAGTAIPPATNTPCPANDHSKLYGWNGDGTPKSAQWPVTNMSDSFGSFGYGAPIIADADGNGRADILAWASYGLPNYTPVHGYQNNGAPVAGFHKPAAIFGISPFCSLVVAVGPNNTRRLMGLDANGNLYSWDLPVSAAATRFHWRMMNGDSGQTRCVPDPASVQPAATN